MNAYEMKQMLDTYFEELGLEEMKERDVYICDYRGGYNLAQRINIDDDGDVILRGVCYDNN